MIKYLLILLATAIYLTFAFHAIAMERNVHAAWEYEKIGNEIGFRLYHENNLACETDDPNATSMNCLIDASDGESSFTITAIFSGGIESPHSAPFSYIFSSDLYANFSADILTGESPLDITFNATASSGNIISYEWMFGDGEIGNGNIVSHTFVAAGTYTVTLKVTDDLGAFDQTSETIIVTGSTTTNTPPLAVISSSKTVGNAPLDVKFDGTKSSDSDGEIIAHHWDLGDGGISTKEILDHSYITQGTFNAALTVTDNGGLTDSTSTPVLVLQPPGGENIPPSAVITVFPYNPKKPKTIWLSARNSRDQDGRITNYSWNFGDGTKGYGITAKHTYWLDAVYTLTLTVTDNKGAKSQPAKHTVVIKNGRILLPGSIYNIITIIDHILLKPVFLPDEEVDDEE